MIDIFFATIVASLPALNGLIDQGCQKIKSWVSTSSNSLAGHFRSRVTSNENPRKYHAKLPSLEIRKVSKMELMSGRSLASSVRSNSYMTSQATDLELQPSTVEHSHLDGLEEDDVAMPNEDVR